MPSEPVYEEGTGDIRIFTDACEKVIPSLEGINCVVTSVPYNQLDVRVPSDGTNLMKGNGWIRKVRDHGYDDNMPEEEYQEWLVYVAELLYEACVPGASFFFNHKVRYRDFEMLHPLDIVRKFKGWKLYQEIVWDRTVAIAFNSKRFAPCDERIYWLVKEGAKPTWNQVAAKWMSVWTMSPMNNDGGDHPCPFPIELAHKCIEATTNPGDLVLDPFMGSGTVVRASKDLGRRGVGIELRQDFVDIAVRRLGQEVLF